MNTANVNKAMAIMERVKVRGDRLNMTRWQHIAVLSFEDAKETEEALHHCGTAACFGGYVAVSPEFTRDGGSVDPISGAPQINDQHGSSAIRTWLNIPPDEADGLCGIDFGEDVYGIRYPASAVTVDDVLVVLRRLRDTGSVFIDGAAQ